MDLREDREACPFSTTLLYRPATSRTVSPDDRNGVDLTRSPRRWGMMGWTAPRTASIVPRWSLSQSHLKGSRPWAGISVDCHARWSRSGDESVSGSRSRREGRDRCGAQARARPARCVFLRAPAVSSGDGGLLLGAPLGAATAGARLRVEADPAGAGEALCPAQQERRGQCGGDLRGGGAGRASGSCRWRSTWLSTASTNAARPGS